MTTLETLSERFLDVKRRIAESAARSGRSGSDVLLVAVTKHAGVDQIRELVQLGHLDYGENHVQQLVQRAAMVDEWLARHRTLTRTAPPGRDAGPGTLPERVRWHLIGHLQRNKVKKAIETARLIHSVDSLRLAEEMQAVALRRDQAVDILVQVNVSGEGTKSGCAPAAVVHLVEQIDTMINLRVRGLMTMAPHADNPELARPVFARCRELFEEVVRAGVAPRHFNVLSMGMSGDYEVAVEEGANVVRVGSAIFGEGAGAPHLAGAQQGAEQDEDEDEGDD